MTERRSGFIPSEQSQWFSQIDTNIAAQYITLTDLPPITIIKMGCAIFLHMKEVIKQTNSGQHIFSIDEINDILCKRYNASWMTHVNRELRYIWIGTMSNRTAWFNSRSCSVCQLNDRINLRMRAVACFIDCCYSTPETCVLQHHWYAQLSSSHPSRIDAWIIDWLIRGRTEWHHRSIILLVVSCLCNMCDR